MARHIQLISNPVASYLSQRFGRTLRGKKSGNSETTLPPHLQWAYLRGEALLIKRFFTYFEQRNIEDVDSQLFFWQQFKCNPNALPLLSIRTGLIVAFSKQVSRAYLERIPEEEQHYTAYCCLLWDIHQQDNKALLNTATYTFFSYFSATIFPSKASKSDPNKLKREIRKHLAQQWNLRPDIRESFRESEDGVSFSLIARIGGYAPVTLITLNGKRLKPTRMKACQTVLQQLEQGLMELDTPKQRVAKR